MTTASIQLVLTTLERQALYRNWREIFAKGECSATDFLIYALLRGADPRKGFTPIRNRNKLGNGMQPEQSYQRALLTASNMAGHTLNAKLRALFPESSADRLSELVGGIWRAATERFYTNKEA